MASRLSAWPRRVGNSGAVGSPPCSVSQSRSAVTVSLVSGVIRSLRPLPWQATWAPAPRCRSAEVRPISSEIRSPVWTASSSRAWSRRPVQVVWSRRAEQGVDLGVGEVADQCLVEAFGWDRQDPGDGSRRVRGGSGRRSGTASGSRPGGRCGSGRCCRGRVRDGRGTPAIRGASRSAEVQAGRWRSRSWSRRSASSSRQVSR